MLFKSMCSTLGHKIYFDFSCHQNIQLWIISLWCQKFRKSKRLCVSKSFLPLIGLENKRESYVYISRVFIDGCDNDLLTKNSTDNLGFSFLPLVLRKRLESMRRDHEWVWCWSDKKCCKAVCTILDHSCQSLEMKNVFLAVKSLYSHQFKLYPK